MKNRIHTIAIVMIAWFGSTVAGLSSYCGDQYFIEPLLQESFAQQNSTQHRVFCQRMKKKLSASFVRRLRLDDLTPLDKDTYLTLTLDGLEADEFLDGKWCKNKMSMEELMSLFGIGTGILGGHGYAETFPPGRIGWDK